jgi:hypothetical protein
MPISQGALLATLGAGLSTASLRPVYVVERFRRSIAGHDPDTGQLTRLFHPRQDDWAEHFAWDGPALRGLTAVARTTIDVLRINLPERVEHRRLLLELGAFRISPR